MPVESRIAENWAEEARRMVTRRFCAAFQNVDPDSIEDALSAGQIAAYQRALNRKIHEKTRRAYLSAVVYGVASNWLRDHLSIIHTPGYLYDRRETSKIPQVVPLDATGVVEQETGELTTLVKEIPTTTYPGSEDHCKALAIHTILNKLDPTSRSILLTVYNGDGDVNAYAEACGISRSMGYLRIKKARTKLEKLMMQEGVPIPGRRLNMQSMMASG